MEASEVLKRARKGVGLSQRELSRRAGVPQPAIARIEAARVTPRVDTLNRLLAACGQELCATELLGAGIDRSVIRRLKRLSPRARLELAVTEAANLARLLESARR